MQRFATRTGGVFLPRLPNDSTLVIVAIILDLEKIEIFSLKHLSTFHIYLLFTEGSGRTQKVGGFGSKKRAGSKMSVAALSGR